MIENPPHDRVDHIDERVWAAVEGWNRRKNDRTRFEKRRDIARVNQIPRSLAWDDDQFSALL